MSGEQEARVTAADVKEALRRRHGCMGGSGEWVCIEEAFSGWQSLGGGIDLLAIGVWKTAKVKGCPGAGKAASHPVVAYEVKVSRSDYRREVNGYTPGPNAKWNTRGIGPWPYKAHWALERSHYYLFATPAGLLKPEEIERRERPEDGKGLWLPPEAGLVEIDGRGCRVVVAAPRRSEPPPFGRAEAAELIRHAADPNTARMARRDAAYWKQRAESAQAALYAQRQAA